jgi:hypothetical protein
MTECEECAKKLGIIGTYRHPTMGRKHFLCSDCFDQVSESVAEWGRFVQSNSFNNNSKGNVELNFKRIVPVFNQISNMFDTLLTENEINIKRGRRL